MVADPASPAPMGFPEGVAKKILMQSFDKYTFRDYKDTEHYRSSSRERSAGDKPPPVKPTPKTDSTAPQAEPTAASPAPATASTVAVAAAITQSSPPQAPIGNGGLGPGYYWTQTLKEITIYIDLATGPIVVRYCLCPCNFFVHINQKSRSQISNVR